MTEPQPNNIPEPTPAPKQPAVTPNEPAPEPKQDGAKTFTQEELDKIVKDRLDRERKKHADYDDLKAKASKLDELEKEKLSTEEKAAKRLQELEAKIAEKEAAIAVKELLDKKRSALEGLKLALPDGTTISDLLTMMPGGEDDIPDYLDRFKKLFPATKSMGTGTQNVKPPAPKGIDDQIAEVNLQLSKSTDKMEQERLINQSIRLKLQKSGALNG